LIQLGAVEAGHLLLGVMALADHAEVLHVEAAFGDLRTAASAEECWA